MTEEELPPAEVWISREEHAETAVIEMRHEEVPGSSSRWISGVLNGSWPKLGHVRRLPSSEREQIVTEVTIELGRDGTVHPVNPDER